MNRKLIRPNLADVKPPEREQPRNQDARDGRASGAIENAAPPRRNLPPQPARGSAASSPSNAGGGAETIDDGASAQSKSGGRRNAPPVETNAKVFYYKKQIDSHTRMIIVLQDNEEIEGTIEWYDRNALKINRKTEPNIMLLEHNIKYMYKVED